MSDLTIFDQSPRRAFAAMAAEDKTAWHIRYCAQEGAEPRVWVLVERVESEMRTLARPSPFTRCGCIWRTGRARRTI